MTHSLEIGTTRGAFTAPRRDARVVPVGASYGFDPGADGIAGIYAARVLERGADPRSLCADIRADRLGSADRESRRRALTHRPRAIRFGRGTAQGLRATNALPPPNAAASGPARPAQSSMSFGRSADTANRRPRQLAIAGLLAALLFPLGIILANAQETPPRARYIVQPGDTLVSVAADVFVISDPGQSPYAAAANSAMRRHRGPFGHAHSVAPM